MSDRNIGSAKKDQIYGVRPGKSLTWVKMVVTVVSTTTTENLTPASTPTAILSKPFSFQQVNMLVASNQCARFVPDNLVSDRWLVYRQTYWRRSKKSSPFNTQYFQYPPSPTSTWSQMVPSTLNFHDYFFFTSCFYFTPYYDEASFHR